MSIRKKSKEIKRLIKAFEIESDKFHDLEFSTFNVTQSVNENKIFKQPAYSIMLWQYYGKINEQHTKEDFLNNFKESNLQWGLRGAELSAFGLIEGETLDLFIKMAKRASKIFNKKEIDIISTRVTNEIKKENSDKVSVLITSTNSDSLAIWLNFLLYYISKTPNFTQIENNIDIDPYTLSLFALEQLLDNPYIEKIDKSISKLENINFDVALSFPGEKRAYVSKVANILRNNLDEDKLFYDFDYQAQLARPNVDILLQKIYSSNSTLIVVFLSSEYSKKEWCGLEWRAIRNIIKSKDDNKIMFIRFDDTSIEGLFSIDGYIDANKYKPKEVAKFILERMSLNN